MYIEKESLNDGVICVLVVYTYIISQPSKYKLLKITKPSYFIYYEWPSVLFILKKILPHQLTNVRSCFGLHIQSKYEKNTWNGITQQSLFLLMAVMI